MPGYDDGLHDSMALTEALLRDDMESVVVILRYANTVDLSLTLAKLLAEVLAERDIAPAEFRLWAHLAARRST